MKKFNQFIAKFADFLQICLVIAIAILGIFLILTVFREFIPLFESLVNHSIQMSNTKIMDEIILFFLFFEFASMAVAAMQHHGHTSVSFLMELGVTALLRNLIAAHGNVTEIISTAVAILLLIIGLFLFNKNDKDQLM